MSINVTAYLAMGFIIDDPVFPDGDEFLEYNLPDGISYAHIGSVDSNYFCIYIEDTLVDSGDWDATTFGYPELEKLEDLSDGVLDNLEKVLEDFKSKYEYTSISEDINVYLWPCYG